MPILYPGPFGILWRKEPSRVVGVPEGIICCNMWICSVCLSWSPNQLSPPGPWPPQPYLASWGTDPGGKACPKGVPHPPGLHPLTIPLPPLSGSEEEEKGEILVAIEPSLPMHALMPL